MTAYDKRVYYVLVNNVTNKAAEILDGKHDEMVFEFYENRDY